MKGESKLKVVGRMKDKRGVFGLTAVQAFFSIILGIALLAYVIVVIMGTLTESNIINAATASQVNETGGVYANQTGYTVTQSSIKGFGSAVLTGAFNFSDGTPVPTENLTLTTAGVLTNATDVTYANLSIIYSYSFDSDSQNNLEGILGNTSTGVTGFFESINSVYAILAVLVIILVLVVLVRVVQAPNKTRDEPQL